MTEKKRIGLYPGTFDPITLGHLDIIARGAKLVDRLIIGISTNPAKTALLDLDERMEIVRRETAIIARDTGVTIEVTSFNRLLVTYADEVGATCIIRGLRSVADFEYEFQMTAMNHKLNSDIETIFLMADPALQAIASRLVKEIARFGGDISDFVPEAVRDDVMKKIK